ncbi:hypothetical protein L6R52_05210 [Myxococcota bacterium]|nr:hypothetical protein [Myxococcota bacterium]
MEISLDGIHVSLAAPKLAVGLVVARGCATTPAPDALARAIDDELTAAKARSAAGGVEVITGPVRDMLRHGKYKPTGRGKPASEYLDRSAVEDRFPRINNLVDINNLISLRTLLPISLVDLGRAARDRFVVRHGRAGESYVFNSAGQVIELADLLLVARLPEDEPCANPVKDSMATKLNDASTDVMSVLYAPAGLAATVATATKQFEDALVRWGGARSTASGVLGG